ncbi:type II toxin-antitoxin system HicA family toxin [Spartinivicinus poritis]|uniref:Type II toxin-antitoxin system HicA family toxin n=4 Tax=Spartinivicinus TaxID=2768738 RepID=A0ABT5UIA4_9GAMM|nr:type II toxin-antitoxin system HicA family toxin [Spartinivicinus sp. A2-2]MDE1465945.1 type II toxin-antitoxin system HicA family toxin [Spartinivicinus sp. A2-2]
MNNRHRRTLQRVFQKPTLSSIAWRDIEALFKAAGGEIHEGAGSRVHVVLNDEVATFHRPHPEKEACKGAVESAKRFLEQAGVKP